VRWTITGIRAPACEQPLDKQLGQSGVASARANGMFVGAEAPGAGDCLLVSYALLLNLIGVLGGKADREQCGPIWLNYIPTPIRRVSN
jgi:lysyl-tRNA synthetase class 1